MVKVSNSFEELLRDAGFSVVDGEADYNIPDGEEKLHVLLEIMMPKTLACVEEAEAAIAELEKVTDKNSESYAQLSEHAALINERIEKIKSLADKISKEIKGNQMK